MNESLTAMIRERVEKIETMPAIPAVFLPLLKLLSATEEDVKVDEVVRLVSYDNTIAAQCLRLASSPLFGLAQPPKSIKGAVISLGMRRVETILMTCCLGQAFPVKKWVLDPEVFWRHSLGCAMVCRKFSEKLANSDHEKAYMAGLLHDIGFMVNCLSFPNEFAKVMEWACQEGIPLWDAELARMGFTHCETGEALAEKWHLDDDVADVILHHHAIEQSQKAQGLVALVHLSDLLCRMRGLGYGYYERHMVDLIADPAWSILAKEHRELEGMDLVRFTFELDETVEEIHELVATVFGAAPVGA
ncbi:MAG: HDOD domain-containing protein [Acidobacteria bacterium]|nr:HDOD domain-containing protein [Acidobacteriota bacterium]